MDWDLPEKLDRKFVDTQIWQPGPLEFYEVCELGLVRRPLSTPYCKGAMQPGYLYSPEVRSGNYIRYRLHKLGEKRPIYYEPYSVMMEAFRMFRNEGLKDSEYVAELRVLVVEFNKNYFSTGFKNHRGEKTEEFGPGAIPMRKCTTCGKPTRNYRCEACWVRIKAGTTSCDEPGAEYRLGRR